MKKQQIQQQIQMTAYQKKTAHDIFLVVMEWFEKYIEVSYKNEFPDWENRKQIRNNLTIKRRDIYENPERAEKTLSSQLHLFAATLEEDTTPQYQQELKQEFYQWLNAVRIDVNNCPERLKHFIFGINEIFDGNYEKIRSDIANRKRDIEIDDPRYLEKLSQMFADTQPTTHREMEVEKSLKGKIHTDIEVENKFSGSVEQGEETFKQIAASVGSGHQNFYFKEQKGQSTSSSSYTPQQLTNFEIIQDVRQNPRNWRIDEVITEYNNRGIATKRELALIHSSAQVGYEGAVADDRQPVYLAQRFDQREIAQINQALNISQSQSSAQVEQQQQYKWIWE